MAPAPLGSHDWHGARARSCREMVRRAEIAKGFWAEEVARAGETRLRTWFTQKNGTSRGAYFVEAN